MELRSISSFFSKPPKNNRFHTIAIDGRGGSGKTAFTAYLKTLLPDFFLMEMTISNL